MSADIPFASQANIKQTIEAQGLACPLPLLKLKQALHQHATGEHILLIASDPHSQQDIQRFCQIRGHQCQLQQANNQFYFLISK